MLIKNKFHSKCTVYLLYLLIDIFKTLKRQHILIIAEWFLMNEQYQYTCVIFLSLILNINVLNGTKPSIIWFMVSFTHRLWSLPLTACFYRLSRARLPLWGPGWRWRQSRYQLWPPLIVHLEFLKSKETNIHTNTVNTGNIRDSKIFSHF